MIELLIVVAIVGILTTVAVPSYQEYIRRGARSEAKAGLLQAQQWMERAATVAGVYPTQDANGENFFPAGLQRVDSKRYTIALSQSTASSFTLTATPQGSQQGDRCGSFTLSHNGVRGNTDIAQNISSVECWSR